ncbi:mitochondrial fission process protein 1 [Cephus cinctus]|uniref:Mitochondrial fission process protein 1 n=1 Tax=Cephus cinctus TaxID=211228 RepID=A0AAJ7BSH8_CEPCN|nr:mitochondrial fission process protein 1 [Cephus cinctus]
MANKEREVDLYRHTSVRYLGYANEVGEAFRSIVPKSIVWLSYIISSGYVLADTLDKGWKVHQKDSSPLKNKRMLLSVSDTLLWQGFASVIIPGLTINRICAGVRYAQTFKKGPIGKSPWVCTIIGLISIPFIIHPIDVGVEKAMNATYRNWTGYHPHKELD